MKHQKILLLVLITLYFFSCNRKALEPLEPSIIPFPETLNISEGVFLLNINTTIFNQTNFDVSETFLKGFLGSKIKGKAEANSIGFIMDETISNDESYTLLIEPTKISIKAKTDAGAFYAIQSLRQLLPPEIEGQKVFNKPIAIKCLEIKDKPAFAYRGMHLDVARHFYSVDFIKKYLDVIAMLKFNTFHWHLTDDQGWRIEIKKYPKLQEVSAFRDETLIGHYSDQPHQFDGKHYGGFYTQDEVKEIVAYAKSRAIDVIPEIEMPGHAQAAIAAYPYLGCKGEQVKVATKWGVFEDIYCTNDEVFKFLEDVLDEVITLFPSKYIHIGGDEAPKTRWNACEVCHKKIKEEGIKDTHELQNYFITRMETYLNSNGKQIIGWDEILEGGLAPNATVMSWRGIEGAIQAAKQKHDVIMTPTSHCYFDYYQSDSDDEPLAIGGYLPVEKVYHFNPIPEELNEEEAKYIIGAQGNIWTEYMSTSNQVEYMMLPRVIAMSEVIWSRNENKNYENFATRLEVFNKRLDILNYNYANYLYEIESDLSNENKQQYISLKTLIKDKIIRYTIDDSEPNVNSEIYISKIPISESITIKAAVFNQNERLGNVFKQTINKHKAVGKKITINRAPHTSNSGSGVAGLINGVSGSDTRYGDKEWLGFWGEDLEIEIDLGEEIQINSIETRFHNGNGQWIYAPKEVQIELDSDKITSSYNNKNQNDLITNLKEETNIKARYIKFKIPSYGIIREGNQGAGQKAWTFIDEIIIN